MDIYNGRNEVVCKVDTERCSKRKTYSDCQIVIRRAHLNFSFSDTVEYIVGKLYMEPEQFDGTMYKVAFPYYEGAVMVCEFTGKNFDDEAYTHLICAVAETLHTIIDEHLAKSDIKVITSPAPTNEPSSAIKTIARCFPGLLLINASISNADKTS